MAIVAGILVIAFLRRRSSVYGGVTIGAIGVIVGLILAIVKGNWSLLALSFAIGTFVGLGVEGFGRLFGRLRGN